MNITFPSIKRFINSLKVDYIPKGVISRDEVLSLIEKRFGKVDCYVMNPEYNLFSKEQYYKFRSFDQTDQRIYTENNNCVIFAMQYMMNARVKLRKPAVGLLFTHTHVINFDILDTKEFEITEPQNDNYFNPENREFLFM